MATKTATAMPAVGQPGPPLGHYSIHQSAVMCKRSHGWVQSRVLNGTIRSIQQGGKTWCLALDVKEVAEAAARLDAIGADRMTGRKRATTRP
jgi:hypothetical protein